MNDELIGWLLESTPYVAYRARRDLLEQPEDAPDVQAARQAMLTDPRIRTLLDEAADWPGAPLKSHKSAGHLLHKVAFLADLGLTVNDPPIARLVERIQQQQASEGPFQVLMNIPQRYGGTGEDQWAWMLCDAPVVLYALVKFGVDTPEIQAAFAHLAGLIRDNGWPCAATPDFGKFRGPGRKDDPCPYANLVMLKALSQYPQGADHAVIETGAETLLMLWEQRKERKSYLFGMGTDFAKLKAPLIWYDILHVTEVLSHCSWLYHDTRLQQMLDIIQAKADDVGCFTPESVWRDWKDWDFGQKRQPSPWLTLLVQRLLKSVRGILEHS